MPGKKRRLSMVSAWIFTRIIPDKCPSSVSAKLCCHPNPALLIKPATFQPFSRQKAWMTAGASGSFKSSLKTKTAVFPLSSSASFRSLSSRRATKSNVIPSSAKARANPSPIPLLAPVMMITSVLMDIRITRSLSFHKLSLAELLSSKYPYPRIDFVSSIAFCPVVNNLPPLILLATACLSLWFSHESRRDWL